MSTVLDWNKLCVHNVILIATTKSTYTKISKNITEKTTEKYKWNFKNIQVTHRKAGKRKQRRKNETNRRTRNIMSDISIITLNVNDFYTPFKYKDW